MMADRLHNDVRYIRGISPSVATADNTAVVSQIVDTANHTACEFILSTGLLADASGATFTVLVEDGNDSGLSDNAAVADVFLLGTEAGASFTLTEDDAVFKIGYIGPKRYVRVTITPAANAGDSFMSAVWALAGSRKGPWSDQSEGD
jgi:hypothetical protein